MFRLLLFVKAPRPGFVKTRLAAELGPDAACAAYCVVVSALLEQLQAETAVDLLFTPDSAALELEPWRRPGWSLHPQGDGDLGERLVRAGREAFARGVTGLAIIGSDCPYLTAADLAETRARLEDHDIVLGPATDGGYWLIAMKQSRPALFAGIPWSTGEVLVATLARCAEAGLRVHLLRELSDIDTREDWERFRTTENLSAYAWIWGNVGRLT